MDAGFYYTTAKYLSEFAVLLNDTRNAAKFVMLGTRFWSLFA